MRYNLTSAAFTSGGQEEGKEDGENESQTNTHNCY